MPAPAQALPALPLHGHAAHLPGSLAGAVPCVRLPDCCRCCCQFHGCRLWQVGRCGWTGSIQACAVRKSRERQSLLTSADPQPLMPPTPTHMIPHPDRTTGSCPPETLTTLLSSRSRAALHGKQRLYPRIAIPFTLIPITYG